MGTMVVVTLVIMFKFSVITTIAAILLIVPGAAVSPVYGHYNREAIRMMQGAKAKANGLAEERIGNVRTVKAFADEKGSSKSFLDLNEKVYQVALYKGKIWGTFMFSMKLFTMAALAGMILIVAKQVENETLTIGETMSYLLYMQNVTRNIGEMVGNLTQLFKIQGAANAVAEIIYSPVTVKFEGTEKPKDTTMDSDT